MKITIEDAAAALDGCEFREEGSKELFAQMRGARLVAAFGASDDLLEFRGAICDEIGAGTGCTAWVDATGLIDAPDCDCDAARELYELKKANAHSVTATWCPPNDDASWAVETSLSKSAAFRVMEGQDVYCIGVVFELPSQNKPI